MGEATFDPRVHGETLGILYSIFSSGMPTSPLLDFCRLLFASVLHGFRKILDSLCMLLHALGTDLEVLCRTSRPAEPVLYGATDGCSPMSCVFIAALSVPVLSMPTTWRMTESRVQPLRFSLRTALQALESLEVGPTCLSFGAPLSAAFWALLREICRDNCYL